MGAGAWPCGGWYGDGKGVLGLGDAAGGDVGAVVVCYTDSIPLQLEHLLSIHTRMSDCDCKIVLNLSCLHRKGSSKHIYLACISKPVLNMIYRISKSTKVLHLNAKQFSG